MTISIISFVVSWVEDTSLSHSSGIESLVCGLHKNNDSIRITRQG